MTNFATPQLDEYYDVLIEEEIDAYYEEAYAEARAEMDAENAWLRHAESQGLSHQQELEEEGH